LEKLVKKVTSWAAKCEYVVIAGSLPPGVPMTATSFLFKRQKNKGQKQFWMQMEKPEERFTGYAFHD